MPIDTVESVAGHAVQRIESLAPIAVLAVAFTVVWAQPASVPTAGTTAGARGAPGLTGAERRDWSAFIA